MGRAGQRRVGDAAQAGAAVTAALDQIEPGARVAVAVSGGPDSTALALLVRRNRPDLHAVVVHVRHGLRDDAPDAAAARNLARHLGVEHTELSIVVEPAAGVEADARRARYDALARYAAESGTGWVLTGHTADDQAETVLLNLARGAGLAGASGMPRMRALGTARLLRPLLGLRRAVVRAIAAELVDAGVVAVADPMNDDLARRRTRVRNDVLPALATLTGGGTDPVEALTRFASAAAEDDAALTAAAEAFEQRELRSWGPIRGVRFRALDDLPRAVASRVVRRMAAVVSTDAGGTTLWPSAEATDRVLALRPGAFVTVPAGAAHRGNGWLTVAMRDDPGPPQAPLLLGGAPGDSVALAGMGVTVQRSTDAAGGTLPFWAPNRAAAVVPAPPGPLTVRPLRRGDEIAGTPNRDLVAAARACVPRPAREWVVVVADDGGPVWAPGLAVRAGLRDAGAGFLRLVPSFEHAPDGYAANRRTR